MKYLSTYKLFESVDDILDTINDILVEVNNDIDGWNAKVWKKYEGETLPKNDIVVVLTREGSEYREVGKNEWEIIKSMRIPNEVIITIKRLIDFMNDYKYSIVVGKDDLGPGDPDDLADAYIHNGHLVDKNGMGITELWMDEFIRIEFTK